MLTHPDRFGLLDRIGVSLGYRAARRAVDRTRREFRDRSSPWEPHVTPALMARLRGELTSVGGGRHNFRFVLYRAIDESQVGPDVQLVLRTPRGSKWLTLQAKRGDRIRDEWSHLQTQCQRMTRHGSAKALVYYEDAFVAADCRKVLSGEAPPPTSGRVLGNQPDGWRDFPELIRDFLQCWVGSMGWPPVVNAGLLGFILHGSSDGELDDLQRLATGELGGRYEAVDPNTWISHGPDHGPTSDGSERDHWADE